MTNKNLELANEITKKISALKDLRIAVFKPYLHFLPFRRSWNGVCVQDDNTVIICDEELNKVIKEYCDRRIEELESDLAAL